VYSRTAIAEILCDQEGAGLPYLVRNDSVSASASHLDAARGSEECIMKTGAVAASLLVLSAATSPASAGTLGWGEKAGEESTIILKSGIDTSQAIIKAKQNREDADSYCKNYLEDGSSECIDKILTDPREDTVTADCVAGKFYGIYGYRQFLETENGYVFVREDGTIEENMPGLAEYPIDGETFRALCPSRVKKFNF
jgi:hypothetical protein